MPALIDARSVYKCPSESVVRTTTPTPQLSTSDSTGPLKSTERRPQEILLECEIPKGPGTLTIIGLGIQTHQEQAGKLYKMHTGNGYMILEAMV